MRKVLLLACVIVGALQAGLIGQKAPQNDWPNYGRDPGGARNSPLKQITPQNVTKLQRAWVYHTGEKIGQHETTPIVVGNVMYLSTPSQRVIALDATTGAEIWTFAPTPKVARIREHRGVSYWPGEGSMGPRIILATTDARLMALDAKTGALIPDFGNNGQVDLREGYIDKFPQGLIAVTSPPAIYKNLAILGHSNQEGPSKGPSGDPRAFDVKTGKLVWRFRLVPHPGEAGNETWGPPDGWIDRAGPSTWGLITVDTERGLVFIPTGNPADSYYGGDRKGTNRFAAAILCLDAATGKLKWDYQTTHHDIYDMDLAAAPALIEVNQNGKKIPAVAQITKMALLFILNRETGEPIFGVEERPVPKTDVPGDEAWPTQPFPVKPPVLARNSFKPSEISRISPETEKFCIAMAEKYTNLGPYTPFRVAEGTVLFSGTAGGGNWGGVAFDPITGYILVNTSEMGTIGRMVKGGQTPARGASPSAEPSGAAPPAGRGVSAPPLSAAAAARQVMPYRNEGGSVRFVDQDKYPCQAPPWGKLAAVNANTGDIAWQVILGAYDEFEAKGLKGIGAANLGGPIVTASGLTFIAATNDLKLRAFETKTGKELWIGKLDASGNATPITYLGADNRQYVTIVAGGPGHLRTIGNNSADVGDTIVAFALPK